VFAEWRQRVSSGIVWTAMYSCIYTVTQKEKNYTRVYKSDIQYFFTGLLSTS